MRFALTTDFRNPSGSGKSSARVYAEIIDALVFAASASTLPHDRILAFRDEDRR